MLDFVARGGYKHENVRPRASIPSWCRVAEIAPRPFLSLDAPRWGWVFALAVSALGVVSAQSRELATLERAETAASREAQELHQDIRELRAQRAAPCK